MTPLRDVTVPGDERARRVVALRRMLGLTEQVAERALADALQIEAWELVIALEAVTRALQDAREAADDQETVAGDGLPGRTAG
jgi:hypothetical protein